MSRLKDLAARQRSVMRAARRVLPPQAQEAVRSTVRAFGQATAQARMLPDFIVAGAQRCGTTTLYRMLDDHPAVIRPLFHKGIGYFDVGYDHPFSWYRGHFPISVLAAARYGDHERYATFESSGYYMFHPLAPQRIAEHLPNVKVVVLVRDPVERALSAHRHEMARGFETEEFEKALQLEPERLEGEVERMIQDPSYLSFHHRHHAYTGRGLYAQQIVALQEALSPSQVFVIDANDFFDQPVEQFVRLQEWLGLPVYRPANVEHANAQGPAEIPRSIRDQLLNQFEGPDLELARLLAATPSWRR